jgi:hypothetical protein
MRSVLLLTLAAIPQWAAEVSGSGNLWKPFLDEEAGFAAGASVRVPVTRRLSVRPEVVGGSIQTYRRLMILGSVTYDVTNPDSAAVAYVVGSAGLNYTRDTRISYSYSEGTALGGAGVRYKMSPRWILGMEVRFGLDAFPLITASVGYRFGK